MALAAIALGEAPKKMEVYQSEGDKT